MGNTMARIEAEATAVGIVLWHWFTTTGLPSVATALAVIWYAIMIYDWFSKKGKDK